MSNFICEHCKNDTQALKTRRFILDLLDPERLGHQASAEIRDRARECIGMLAVEAKDA